MHHVLARAELGVERDRRIVAIVCLDKDHPGALRKRDSLQLADESGCHSAPPHRLHYSEIVDVIFAAPLLIFVEPVGA